MLLDMATSTCPIGRRWHTAKLFANAHRDCFIAIPRRSQILAVSSDFPAITRPWLRLAALKNHTVRFVADQATCDLTDTLIEAIDESTSVVAVSCVQYATGTVVDISRLRQRTVQVG